jgi:hypothetical protein
VLISLTIPSSTISRNFWGGNIEDLYRDRSFKMYNFTAVSSFRKIDINDKVIA